MFLLNFPLKLFVFDTVHIQCYNNIAFTNIFLDWVTSVQSDCNNYKLFDFFFILVPSKPYWILLQDIFGSFRL